MSIRIDGGVVVGWSGAGHEIIPNGSVLIDGNTIKSVNVDKSQPADRVIDASGKIVCPGFINLHVHSQLNVGDYLLTDVTKKDYLAANWFVFGAPLKEKVEPPAPAAVALGRKYALYSALRNGATTVLDPGGGPGALDDYVAIVGQTGGRVFLVHRFAATIFSPTPKGGITMRNVRTKAAPASKPASISSKNFTARITAACKVF